MLVSFCPQCADLQRAREADGRRHSTLAGLLTLHVLVDVGARARFKRSTLIPAPQLSGWPTLWRPACFAHSFVGSSGGDDVFSSRSIAPPTVATSTTLLWDECVLSASFRLHLRSSIPAGLREDRNISLRSCDLFSLILHLPFFCACVCLCEAFYENSSREQKCVYCVAWSRETRSYLAAAHQSSSFGPEARASSSYRSCTDRQHLK